MPLTKYVSVTFTGGSNDGSASNPYTTIEAAREDIADNATDDGPHYIILSEAGGGQTIYSASYGMPSGFQQEFWMGSYNRGVIVSGAHGQDIILDGKGVTGKSAFVFYGSGSGAHNLTIRNIGVTSYANRGALRFVKRPADIRGVVITSSFAGGITGLGDYSTTNAYTIIDRCRIHMPPVDNRRVIDWDAHTRYALINNCLIILSGSATATPSRAIAANYSDSTTFSTASFCTVLVNVSDTNHTDSAIGISAGLVKNCIVSMSLAHETNVNVGFILANDATNNFYAGFNTGTRNAGARRLLNGTSASFDSTDLHYQKGLALTLFNGPDLTFKNIYADWTLSADAPGLNTGTAINYLGLTSVDLSGTARSQFSEPPDMGCFELVTSPGYGHGVLGVASGDIVKVLGVATADIEKVLGI